MEASLRRQIGKHFPRHQWGDPPELPPPDPIPRPLKRPNPDDVESIAPKPKVKAVAMATSNHPTHVNKPQQPVAAAPVRFPSQSASSSGLAHPANPPSAFTAVQPTRPPDHSNPLCWPTPRSHCVQRSAQRQTPSAAYRRTTLFTRTRREFLGWPRRPVHPQSAQMWSMMNGSAVHPAYNMQAIAGGASPALIPMNSVMGQRMARMMSASQGVMSGITCYDVVASGDDVSVAGNAVRLVRVELNAAVHAAKIPASSYDVIARSAALPGQWNEHEWNDIVESVRCEDTIHSSVQRPWHGRNIARCYPANRSPGSSAAWPSTRTGKRLSSIPGCRKFGFGWSADEWHAVSSHWSAHGPAGLSFCQSATNGTTTDHAATNGTATDHTATNGTTTDYAATNGNTTDRVATNHTAVNPLTSHKSLSLQNLLSRLC